MQRAAASAAFAIPAIAYALTLCPTVYVGDSGEMVTLAHTLGVAQPTGFPLYCLLGKIAALVPLGTVAARVNALSALALALAGLAVYRVAARFVSPGFALAGSLTFTLGQTAWSQATIARTYPLTLALTAFGLDLALHCLRRPGQRAFLALALLAGLTLGTHLLSVLLGPIVLYVWLRERASRKAAGVVLTFLGLSLYLYLPLRAPLTAYNAYGPLGSAQELSDYLRQKRYAVKQFSRSSANQAAAARILGTRVATEHPLALVALPVVLLGLIRAWRAHRELAGLLIVPALANLVILYGYGDDTDLPFLPRYFLFCFMAQAILFALGLEALAERLSRRAAYGFAALCVAGALANARLTDRSRTEFPRAYAAALIEALPRESLLFLAGDASSLMIDYLQFVEGARRDVHCGEPDMYTSTIVPLFAKGQTLRLPIFCNFLPAGLPPAFRAEHTGLVWQILPKGQSVALDRARFWAAHPFPGLTTDPALSDYEAAAVAGEILFHQGLDELEAGRPDDARATFARATRASPENRLLFYNLARIGAARGWADEARAYLERALALDVTAREAGEAYARERYRERGLSPVPR